LPTANLRTYFLKRPKILKIFLYFCLLLNTLPVFWIWNQQQEAIKAQKLKQSDLFSKSDNNLYTSELKKLGDEKNENIRFYQNLLVLGFFLFFILCLLKLVYLCLRITKNQVSQDRVFSEWLPHSFFQLDSFSKKHFKMDSETLGFLKKSCDLIKKQAIEQQKVGYLQKTSLFKLETLIKEIAEKFRELSNTMMSFVEYSTNQMESDFIKNKVEELNQGLTTLTQISLGICQRVNRIYNESVGLYPRINYMSKVSEKAALLSFNSAIEVLEEDKYRSIFNDITCKIQQFSENSTRFNREIKASLNTLSYTLREGKKIAEKSFTAILESKEKAVLILDQIEKLKKQDVLELAYFKTVGDLMEKQAKAAGEVALFCEYLSDTNLNNLNSLQSLNEIIAEMEDLKDDFAKVLSSRKERI